MPPKTHWALPAASIDERIGEIKQTGARSAPALSGRSASSPAVALGAGRAHVRQERRARWERFALPGEPRLDAPGGGRDGPMQG